MMDDHQMDQAVDSSPIVSIIVPTFNRLERLRRCVDRIRHDVTIACEIVVVDVGSTDGTDQASIILSRAWPLISIRNRMPH